MHAYTYADSVVHVYCVLDCSCGLLRAYALHHKYTATLHNTHDITRTPLPDRRVSI